MKIGIFGGSFNPIHVGHIALAQALCHEAKLDQLWFLVSPQNPFKREATDLADENIRYEITKKALDGEPNLKASNYEFCLPRPSFMVSTLEHLRSDYPEHEFVLAIGADNWKSFDRWHRYDEILAHHSLIVYPRNGYPINTSTLPPNVRFINAPLYDISSTQIREQIAKGQSIEGMVPKNVEEDIRKCYAK